MVAIPGDILSTNVDSLRRALQPLMQPSHPDRGSWTTLELNLTRCRTIDSAGLNLLVSLLRQCTGQDCRVRALVAGDHLHRIFQFTRLDKHMELVRDGAN